MYFVQQQVLTAWQQMSTHTMGSDAMFQMGSIYGASPLQLTAMRVADDLGTIYATKAAGMGVIVIQPIPPIQIPNFSI